MKLLHIADLHIGKRVYEYSMLEQQSFVLEQILRIVDERKPQAILLAGDIYDKNVPSAEAVELYDDFLTGLSQRQIKTFIVSGNHDSRERINFGSRILSKGNIFISGMFEGELQYSTLSDTFGEVIIWLLPFVKPATARPYFESHTIDSYEQAVKAILADADIDTSKRNILLAHQFVTASGVEPQRSDSEAISVGTMDNVDFGVFNQFDYVALGHIHRPQSIGRKTVRYAGSILKYSFSEVGHKKSATLIELSEKGSVSMEEIPLIPAKDLREVKGALADLIKPENYLSSNQQDFLSVVLTDEEGYIDPIGKLRTVYPNIMRLSFENSLTGKDHIYIGTTVEEIDQKSPMELFEDFFVAQNDKPMNLEQRELLKKMFNHVMEGETL